MPGIRLNRIEGNKGEIRIPSLGVVVARMTSPVALVRRREVATHELGSFDLHAAVSYFNQHLWEDQDYEKEIVMYLTNKRPVKIQTYEGSKLSKSGGELRVEGVEPEWQQSQ